MVPESRTVVLVNDAREKIPVLLKVLMGVPGDGLGGRR